MVFGQKQKQKPNTEKRRSYSLTLLLLVQYETGLCITLRTRSAHHVMPYDTKVFLHELCLYEVSRS